MSETLSGVPKRMDMMNLYCLQWCLRANINNTRALVFNKTGKFIRCPLQFGTENIESTNIYKDPGITLTSIGKFKQCKYELYKKAL